MEGILNDADNTDDEKTIQELRLINAKISRSAMQFVIRFNLYSTKLEKSSSEVSKQSLQQLDDVKTFLEPRSAQPKTSLLEEKKS